MSNKYNKPWKVIYLTHWNTGEFVIQDGKKLVEKIVDNEDVILVETDCGAYFLDADTAEYLVKCVNERKDEI